MKRTVREHLEFMVKAEKLGVTQFTDSDGEVFFPTEYEGDRCWEMSVGEVRLYVELTGKGSLT